MPNYNEPRDFSDDPVWFKKLREKSLRENRQKQAENAKKEAQKFNNINQHHDKNNQSQPAKKQGMYGRDVYKNSGKHVDIKGLADKFHKNNKQLNLLIPPKENIKRSIYGITMEDIATEVFGVVPDGVLFAEQERNLNLAKQNAGIYITESKQIDPKTGETIYFINIDLDNQLQ